MTSKELTKQILESPELKAKVEELVKEHNKESKTYKRWKPEIDEYFWFVDARINDVNESFRAETDIDDGHFRLGNCYRTKELAQKALDRRLLLQELKDYALEVNEGWEPDWSDSEKAKHYICYDFERGRFGVFLDSDWQNLNEIYFKSKELAEKAIEHFGDRLKLLLEKEVWG